MEIELDTSGHAAISPPVRHDWSFGNMEENDHKNDNNNNIILQRTKMNQGSLIREGGYLAGKGEISRKAAEVDIEEMIGRSKCAALYHSLEECLGETNREWRKCQTEVKMLRKCSQEMK